MEALKQYTDLFKNNRALLEGHSAGIMNALRDAALRELETAALPWKGCENYEITDLPSLLAPDYGLNLRRYKINADPASSFHCGVPNLTPLQVYQVNDVVIVPEETRRELADGVYIGSLKEFGTVYPELARDHYGKIADLKNPLTALDTLLAQDGVVIMVGNGIRLEKPVQIVNILNSSEPMMAVRRVLVIAGDDSDVRILSCDHTQNANQDFLALQCVEIFPGKRATLDFYELEESSDRTTRLSTIYNSQEEGSNVMIDGITLSNGVSRNEYFSSFSGPHAHLKLFGMGIEDRKRHLDTYSKVTHTHPDCKTEELFKYVVDGESKGSFGGLILVEKGADRTEAYQSNRNIVDSSDAVMYSKPQLEIYDDDVKCSHGTATGQLDEMQVFYMRTRGLSEETARLLLKQAFMADVIEGVRLQSLRDRLRMLVERRLAGEESACSGCIGNCLNRNANGKE